MQRLDIRGLIQPFSFLSVSNAFKEMQDGEILEVVWHDPESLTDLFKILSTFSYDLVLMEDRSEKGYGVRLRLKKITYRNRKERIMTDVDLNTVEPATTVDARGSACPGPLLEAKKGIGKVKIGEILEIYSSDSGTRTDIPAWARKVGHEYLGLLETDGYDKHFVRRNK